VNINNSKSSITIKPEIRIYSVYNGILLRILLYTIHKNEKVMEDLSSFTSLEVWLRENHRTNRNSETAISSRMTILIYSDDHRSI
jgi:hypothetical protein